MVKPQPYISQLSMGSPASTTSEEELSNDDSDGSDVAPTKSKQKRPRDLESDSKEDIIPPTAMKRMERCSTGPEQTKSDSSDEDDEECPMAADYFQEENPRTNRHKWMVHFYKYLFAPDAGFHKDQNRLQHACQVKRLLEETDPPWK